MWNYRRPQMATATLGMKNNIRGITPPGIKVYYKVIVIKTAWQKHKSRHINE